MKRQDKPIAGRRSNFSTDGISNRGIRKPRCPDVAAEVNLGARPGLFGDLDRLLPARERKREFSNSAIKS
jgi:hypothetical protein